MTARRIDDPEYVQGQIAALRALILGLANLTLDKDEFLQQALERLMRGRTSIIIAHRLSTIRQVDRILVLHKGKLVEAGSHAELLALNGLYARLYELQYREQEAVSDEPSAVSD